MENNLYQEKPEIPSPKDDAQNQLPTSPEAKFYEIHVKGQLDSKWSEWLDGLQVKLLDDGEMLLFGPIIDQAALMGVLNKLTRLNLTLLAINEVKGNNKKASNGKSKNKPEEH